MEPYKITHPSEPYQGPHIGSQLAKKMETHRWHVLRIKFGDEPQPETYEAVASGENGNAQRNKETACEVMVRPADHVAQPPERNPG